MTTIFLAICEPVDYTEKRMKSLYVHIVAITLLTVMAGWLRLAQLGDINLHDDEFYQFETAVGYLETGQFARYNFFTQQTEGVYTRAIPFTWQVILSLHQFGYTEWAARLPAVIWGTALIPVVIISLLWLTRRSDLAYGLGWLLTFDNFFIALSRYVRMYSMIIVLLFTLSVLVYQWLQVNDRRQRLYYGATIVGLTLLSWFTFSELTLAWGAGIGVYIFIRTLYYRHGDAVDRTCAYVFILGSALAVLGTGIHFAGYHIIPVGAFIVRDQPYFFYFNELFTVLQLPVLGVIFFLVGLLTLSQRNSFITFSAITSGSVLLYFIYFSHHWEAKRYIAFLLPGLYLLIVAGIGAVIRFTIQRLKLSRVSSLVVIVAAWLVFGPWLSWPGNSMQYPLLQPAYANFNQQQLGLPDLQRAYSYVVDHYQLGEQVFMQGPRYYYWPDHAIEIQKLGAYKSLTFEDFLELIQAAPAGGWIVYSDNNSRHLRLQIRKYVRHHFQYQHTLFDSGVNVFHFYAI